MELILKEPRCGKTYELIKKSAATGYPIVTPYSADYILNLASDMGLKIPEPIHIDMLKHSPEYYFPVIKIGKVIIDDIDRVLEKLLGLNVEVVSGTMTPTYINNECKKEKTNMYINTLSTIAEKMDANSINTNSINTNYGINQFNDCFVDNSIISRDSISFTCSNKFNITDINIIVPNKVVEIKFADGKTEKMVVHKDDTFDLYKCCFIGIAKHMYKNEYTFEGIEYKANEMMLQKKYVKIVKEALKSFRAKERENEKAERIKKEKEDAIKRRKEKRWKQKERRIQRIEEERREQLMEERKEMINIISEAIAKSKKNKNKYFI